MADNIERKIRDASGVVANALMVAPDADEAEAAD
jgi:hypothetical protein